MFDWLKVMASRIRGVFARSELDKEFQQELEAHLEMLTEENIRQGVPAEEARRAARIRLGGSSQLQETHRELYGLPWLETFFQDVRYGVRQLRRNRGFTAVAVMTLALGIGATTAVFSVVEGVLLRPLPFKDAGRLVRIYQSNPKLGYFRMMDSPADVQDARRQSTVFEKVTFLQEWNATLTGESAAEQLAVAHVDRDFFRTLGVSPLLGRSFLAKEHQKGRDHVVILSNSFWRRRFHFDGRVLGKAVTLDGKPYTVVGVMPKGFLSPDLGAGSSEKTDLWLPWSPPTGATTRGNRDVTAIARLRAGATIAQARTEMDAISERLAQAYSVNKGWRFELVPLLDSVVGKVRLPILVLFAGVLFVMLIGAANVAGLLLAKGAARQKEIAVRAALGGSRLRLIRQLLTESVLLSLAGGVAGVVVGYGGIDLVRAIGPQDVPRLASAGIDQPVLLFALGISLLVGLMFGSAPALAVTRAPVAAGLKEGQREAGRSGLRSRSVLVVLQVALSLVLMVGAGLLCDSFLRLTSVSLGFNPRHVLSFWVTLSSHSYAKASTRLSYYQSTLRQLRALPGVERVGLGSFLALSSYASTPVRIAGRPAPPPVESPETDVGYKAVAGGFFRTLQIPLLKGRYFTRRDQAGALPVVIVDESFVARYFPGEDPLGKRIHVNWGHEPAWRQIVGVVGDVRDLSLESAPSPECYVPLSQSFVTPSVAFVLRTRVKPLSLASAARHVALLVDKDQPVSQIETMDQLYSGDIAQPRFQTAVLAMLSLLALGLTAVGLYGTLAYLATQRTHEYGIRLALGAQRRDILGLVLWPGLKLTAAGVAIGMAGALGLTHLLSSLLFGVRPTDPLTFIVVSLALIGVALFACYIPARRAAKVDPMVALRYE